MPGSSFSSCAFESRGARKPTGGALHRCLAAGEEQSCPDPELFKSDVALFFDKLIAETQARAPCVNTPWVEWCDVHAGQRPPPSLPKLAAEACTDVPAQMRSVCAC